MPKKHTSILIGFETLKSALLLCILCILIYSYVSFDFYTVAIKASILYTVLTNLGVPSVDAFLYSVTTAYQGILGDIGALLHGYPTSRDFTNSYWVAKFLQVFQLMSGGAT